MYNINCLVQVRLHGILNCKQWTNMEITQKLTIFTEELTNYIRSECECSFPNINIYRPIFKCFANSPNHVTFRAYIILFSDFTVDYTVDIVEEWVKSQTSVTILGEAVRIDNKCPVVISTLDDPECSQDAASTLISLIIIIGSISATVVVVVLVIILIVVSCFIASQKTKRYNNIRML